ncbi:MAG: sulfite exporter TauE/SafE family protein [Verrucomicrobiae bacterium]|nr:sulfite exporter TauE/SafE family protein [Verrucomicrobiae bacterium]
MCGPIAIALAHLDAPSAGTPARRARAEFVLGRLAYNLGRVITYAAMGAVFGLAGRTLWLAGAQRAVSIALGVALLVGLVLARPRFSGRFLGAFIERLKAPMTALLRRHSPDALLLLGLLNGLLPCGLVYVAAAGAMTTGDVLGGVGYMLVFGAGTVPMMLALGLSGRLVPLSLRLKLAKAVPVAVVLMACLLVLRGMELGVPFLSPVISGAPSACCHP